MPTTGLTPIEGFPTTSSYLRPMGWSTRRCHQAPSSLTIATVTYYYADHVCYKKTSSQGAASYEVVPPPEGLKASDLPPERATVTVSGTTYYYYKNTFYRQILQEGKLQYAVVNEPQGLVSVNALPAEFEITQSSSGASYFAYQGKYYLPYLEPNGNETYIVVDPPQAPPPRTEVASVSKAALAERNLTVPGGTSLPVRTASELSSATAQQGQRFTAYLDEDLKVGEILAAPKGSKVYGVVAEVETAGSMSGQSKLTLRLTDIEVNGHVIPLSAAPYTVQGGSESKNTAKKIRRRCGSGSFDWRRCRRRKGCGHRCRRGCRCGHRGLRGDGRETSRHSRSNPNPLRSRTTTDGTHHGQGIEHDRGCFNHVTGEGSFSTGSLVQQREMCEDDVRPKRRPSPLTLGVEIQVAAPVVAFLISVQGAKLGKLFKPPHLQGLMKSD